MTDQNPLSIAVTGVSGRMGQMLVSAIAEREDAVLAGATERSGAGLSESSEKSE